MPHEIPNIEQILYSQLAVLDSLAEYIKDSLESCDFDDEELISHMEQAQIALRGAHYRMRWIMQKPESKNVCY